MPTQLSQNATAPVKSLSCAKFPQRSNGGPTSNLIRAGTLTALQTLKAREMYNELNQRGKRKYAVAQIAETFGVSRKTIECPLDRDNAQTT